MSATHYTQRRSGYIREILSLTCIVFRILFRKDIFTCVRSDKELHNARTCNTFKSGTKSKRNLHESVCSEVITWRFVEVQCAITGSSSTAEQHRLAAASQQLKQSAWILAGWVVLWRASTCPVRDVASEHVRTKRTAGQHWQGAPLSGPRRRAPGPCAAPGPLHATICTPPPPPPALSPPPHATLSPSPHRPSHTITKRVHRTATKYTIRQET